MHLLLKVQYRVSSVLLCLYLFVLFSFLNLSVEPHDLLDAIEEAENSNDDENIEKVICGAIKYLRANRSKPEQAMYLGLMYLAKTRPSFFGSEVVIEVLGY